MKKATILAALIVTASILSSCSKGYTCNTYVKADNLELKKERI